MVEDGSQCKKFGSQTAEKGENVIELGSNGRSCVVLQAQRVGGLGDVSFLYSKTRTM